jgi:hypothetical protein
MDWQKFEQDFMIRSISDRPNFSATAPKVQIRLPNHIGLRQARLRGNPLVAGRWTKKCEPDSDGNPCDHKWCGLREESFAYSLKRRFGKPIDEYILHYPLPGKKTDQSTYYDPTFVTDIQEMNLLLEANPDRLSILNEVADALGFDTTSGDLEMIFEDDDDEISAEDIE